ncbi:hypothetical protein [Streptomyces liangshanensis]|uniref:hypothetical protein n=1 Tax=Streptomyces liangshanensis TaxID=2717324 RepID=UPI0036DF75F5
MTAPADARALEGDVRKRLLELAHVGRSRDHWTRPTGLCELPRSVTDFTGHGTQLPRVGELMHAKSLPGVGTVGLITGSAGLGKTTSAVRAAHAVRPSFPDGVLFLDLLGMSQRPLATGEALRQLLRALGVADRAMPGHARERADPWYRCC